MKQTVEIYSDDSSDTIPVRLPSGTKAVVVLPRPFTLKDARHLVNFLAAYVEDNVERPATQEGGDK